MNKEKPRRSIITQIGRTVACPIREPVQLFLDFDGVVNIVGQPPYPKSDTRWLTVEDEPHRFRIRIGRPVRAAIRAWERHDLLIPTWATTWEGHANTTIAPSFGFSGQWPVVPLAADQTLPATFRVDADDSGGTYKTAAVYKALQAGQVVVWVDDVHATSYAAKEFARRVPGASALLIQPRQDTGITKEDLLAIAGFVRSQTEIALPHLCGLPIDPVTGAGYCTVSWIQGRWQHHCAELVRASHHAHVCSCGHSPASHADELW